MLALSQVFVRLFRDEVYKWACPVGDGKRVSCGRWQTQFFRLLWAGKRLSSPAATPTGLNPSLVDDDHPTCLRTGLMLFHQLSGTSICEDWLHLSRDHQLVTNP